MFQTIGQFIVSVALGTAALLGYHQAGLGGAASVYAPVPRYESSLALALTATQTSTMNLVSGVDGNGVVLTGPTCFTIDSGVANTVEDVCGTASGTVVSNLIRGVDSSGYNGSSTLSHAHRVGADVKITDSPYLAQFASLLSGASSLPNSLSYVSHPASTASTTIEDKAYVDGVAIAGAPNGSATVKGIYQEATAAQFASGTATGTTGADLINTTRFNSLTASTSPVNVIASGTLDPSYIPSGLNLTTTSTAPYLTPPGVIEAYTSSTAPNGWLLANGQSVATSSYPNLFSLFGYTYGGSTSTFGLPNLGGRFIAGPSSTLSTTIGATGGATSTSFTPGISAGTYNNGQFGGGLSFVNSVSGVTTTVSTTPPYIILQYIIKF